MGLKWLTEPVTDLPSRLAKKASSAISPSNEVGSPIRGFASGAIEGAGDVLSDMTSPLSLVLSAIGMSGVGRAGRGIQSLGRFGVGPTRETIAAALEARPRFPHPQSLDAKALLQNQAHKISQISDPMKTREYASELAFLNKRSGLPSPELGPLPSQEIMNSVNPDPEMLKKLLLTNWK